MEVDGFWAVFLLGCFGGIAVEVVKWAQLRGSSNWPDYSRSVVYWGVTVALVLVGGVLAAIYDTTDVQGILAVNIGASAPAIIRALAADPPQVKTKKKKVANPDREASFVNFLAAR